MRNVRLDREVRKFMKSHPEKSYKEALLIVADLKEKKKINRHTGSEIYKKEIIQKKIVKLEDEIGLLKVKLEGVGKIKLTFCDNMCNVEVFEINGIEADYGDFGEKYDRDPNNAEEYGCGDMQFTRQPAQRKILRRYGITRKKYNMICGRLEEGLSRGNCSLCQ